MAEGFELASSLIFDAGHVPCVGDGLKLSSLRSVLDDGIVEAKHYNALVSRNKELYVTLCIDETHKQEFDSQVSWVNMEVAQKEHERMQHIQASCSTYARIVYSIGLTRVRARPAVRVATHTCTQHLCFSKAKQHRGAKGKLMDASRER